MSDREWNLLFGILALQRGKIDSVQFVEAALQWISEPSRGLPEHLEASGMISGSDREMLSGVVEEEIAHHGGRADAALAHLRGEARVGGGVTDAALLGDIEALATQLGSLRGESEVSLGGVDGAIGIPQGTEMPGRYSETSEYSRGGMGRILLVHDQHLGRDVALKELLPSASESDTTLHELSPIRKSASLLGRFLTEARVTGQLEHPAIVPVYELGRRPNGALYYTMKLVRGQTLGSAIRSAETLEERLRLLPHFVDLCHAIAYAHSRKVIHRDIKPDNVMLGGFGETVVIDWGLAKVMGKGEDVGDEIMAQSLQTLGEMEELEGDSEHTQDGAKIGTPAYMPPEQAAGRVSEVDERSDVYSLGAVLYALLTRRPPYAKAAAKKVLAQVVEGPPPAITSVENDVPPELVGICERAMAREPDERYQTVAEFAEEVERYQSGALVRAHRYTLKEHLLRYYRKHWAAVNTAAVGLLALLVVGVYSYVSILQANKREQAQRIRAEHTAYVAEVRLAENYKDHVRYAPANEILWAIDENQRNWEWGYLLNACNGELFSIPNVVWGTYSPRGDVIATISRDEPGAIWDADTGQRKTVLSGPPLNGRLYFEPAGTRLAGICQDGTAGIWDPATGERMLSLSVPGERFTALAFGQDASEVITGGDSGVVRLWDAAEGTEKTFFKEGSDGVWAVAVDKTGARLFSVSAGGIVRVWDRASGRELYVIEGQKISISPDGNRLAVAKKELCGIHDAATGEALATLSGHSGGIQSIEFRHDGSRILTSAGDGTAREWDIETGEELHVYDHGERLNCAVYSPDGTGLLTLAFDGGLKVWHGADSRYDRLVQAGGSLIRGALFDLEGRRILATSSGDSVTVWELRHWLEGGRLAECEDVVSDLALSADGTRMAFCSNDGAVRVVSMETGGLVGALQGVSAWAPNRGGAVALDTHGTHAVVLVDAFTPLVWDIDAQSIQASFTGHTGPVLCVAMSSDGQRVVSGSWDNTARVWDAETGTEVLVLNGHEASVLSTAFSPDGNRIATGAEDGSAKVWDAKTGVELLALAGHSAGVVDICFDPDGKRIATASSDTLARVWDGLTGETLLTLSGHQGAVWCICFSPDGSRLVTGDTRGRTKIWDSGSGEELVSLPVHSAGVSSVEFTANGRGILTSSRGGTIGLRNAAPWKSRDLPGDEGLSWRERFLLYRDAELRKAMPATEADEALDVLLVSSLQAARTCLERLARAIERDTENGESGVMLTAGARRRAMARLAFREGDRIVRFNGVELKSPSEAAKVIAGFLGEGTSAADEFSIDVVRQGRPVCFRVHCIEAETVVSRREVPREQALAALQAERAMLQLNRESVLRVSQQRATSMGEEGSGQEWLNGLFVLVLRDPAAKPFYFEMQLAAGDRVRRFDGESIRSMGAVERKYAEWASKLESGEPLLIVQEIERGEFQRLRQEVRIE